ncbi:MAG: hypothetical protein AB8F78_09240 [Saprospiraceae bacterium]
MSRIVNLKYQSSENTEALCEGLLLRRAEMRDWLVIARALNCAPKELDVYAFDLQGQPYSLIVFPQKISPLDVQALPLGQTMIRLGKQCFVPSHAELTVPLTSDELETVFGENGREQQPTLWHPTLGLLQLPSPIRLDKMINPPVLSQQTLTAPDATRRIPMRLASIQVELDQQALEDRLKATEPNEKLKQLTVGENLLMRALKQALNTGGALGRIAAQRLAGDRDPQELLQELEQRSGDEIERLRKLYETDPLEALKHSVPLDNSMNPNMNGTFGNFSMSKFWDRIGLRAASSGSGRGIGEMDGSQFDKLQAMYNEAFQNLDKKGQHQEAAFVLLKLLNQPEQAADYLRKHHHYLDAADIYERKASNHMAAAKCYELGRDYANAQRLYESSFQLEKAGDCANAMGDQRGAFTLWQRQVSLYQKDRKPILASKLLRSKLKDTTEANATLEEGFRLNNQAVDCLVAFLSELPEASDRLAYIEKLRKQLPKRCLDLLKGLTQTVKRGGIDNDEDNVKPLAYSLAAYSGKQKPAALRLLIDLVKDDPEFGVDVQAYLARR